MAKKIFIAGTGTDVGKTFVSAIIIKKLRELGNACAYYKAAMSGNTRRADGSLVPGDAVFAKKISGIAQPLAEMCPFVYENAFSPHLAARIEGVPVDMEKVREGFENVCAKYDFVTMEGSGGIICPIRRDDTQTLGLEDVIKSLGLATLLVADAGLGTINSVVLTIDYMSRKKLPVKGIIFNRFERGNAIHEDNLAVCEEITGVKILATVPAGAENLDLPGLEKLYD